MSDDPLNVLAESEKLIIKQEVSLLEAIAQNAANALDMDALGALGETANKYNIYTDDGGLKFKVVETSEACGFTGCCPSGRICCAPNHQLQLHIFAPELSSSEAIMFADRPCKCGQCCSCLPICTQEMTVYSGPDTGPPGGEDNSENQIAYITQPFMGGILSPQLNVMDRAEDGEEIAIIKSNAVCCIGGMCCDQTFEVTSPDGEYMGKIVKEAPEGIADVLKELATDADNFTMYIPKDLDTKKKAALLGSLHLLDYMFFESGGAANVDLTSIAEGGCAELNIKCCDMYCCGCLCPCTCTLGGGGGDETEEEPTEEREPAEEEEVEEEEVEEEEPEEEPEE